MFYSIFHSRQSSNSFADTDFGSHYLAPNREDVISKISNALVKLLSKTSQLLRVVLHL